MRSHFYAILTTLLLLIGLGAPSAGCKNPPRAPKLTAESAKVLKVSAKGVEIEVTIDVHNPNPIPLAARKVTARVKLDNEIDLGEVTVDSKMSFPAEKHTKLVVPITLEWGDLPKVAMLASKKEKIPFHLDGKAEVGVDEFNFDIPFETDGEISRQQILDATKQSLPFPIPLEMIPTAIPSGLFPPQ